MSTNPIIVLKFGSSVLESEADLPRVVSEIYRHVRAGQRVVAVVSAFGDTTDRLLQRVEAWGVEHDPRAVAALLATGEAESGALLGLALDRAGVPSSVWTAHDLGLQTTGSRLDAAPVTFNVDDLRARLERTPVVVTPGFVGIDASDGGATLLGRGGSDLTAVVIATQLLAACRLVKDVDGLYESDPNDPNGPTPRRYATITIDDALALDAAIVQPKAIRAAARAGRTFMVGGLGDDGGATVGAVRTTFAPPRPTAPPLRIGVIGCGVVGTGVIDLLRRTPACFELIGVSVRDVAAYADRDLPLIADPHALLRRHPDVLVEVAGGVQLTEVIEHALQRGVDVVTANKRIIAAHGPRLDAVARAAHARLSYSAAVGGGAPLVEAVRRVARDAGPIVRLRGVLNGACNFVLDQISDGAGFEDAVELARIRGFTERDPSLDLDGVDAADKLAILARIAFEEGLTLDNIAIEGVTTSGPEIVRAHAECGERVRLVAEAHRTPTGVDAHVGLTAVPADHRFARTRGEWNALEITSADGDVTAVTGRGAGRWPTAESVFGDLLDLHAERGSVAAAPAGRDGRR